MEKQRITDALVYLGVKRSLNGFDYIVKCVEYEIKENKSINRCIHMVADDIGCNPAAVERCIRTAIDGCIMPDEARKRLFGNQKMTTAIFIKTVASCIKDDMFPAKM